MSRRVVVWLVSVPLAVLGSQVAHELAYRLVTPGAEERAHALSASGHAYLTYAPILLAVCSVLVVLGLAGELAHLLNGGGDGSKRPSPAVFASLAPAIFAFQEHFERVFHDGAFPWDEVVRPTFVVGLLLQAPFALAAYLVARGVLGAVRSLARLLGLQPRRVGERVAARAPARPFVPGPPALALGYGSRGPPPPR